MTEIEKSNIGPVILATQSKKENTVVNTLTAQAEKFGFGNLIGKKDLGEQTYQDLMRVESFFINDIEIGHSVINQICDRYNNLVPDNKSKGKDYRPFLTKVFTDIFNHADVTLSGPIIGDLINKYNQEGYDGNNSLKYGIDSALDQQHRLLTMGSIRKVKMYCNDPNSLKIKLEMETSIVHSDNPEKKEDKLSISFELTVESKNGEEDITYKDGKLLLTVPRELENYRASNEEVEQSHSDTIVKKSFIDNITEYFLFLIEKFVNIKPENRKNIYDMIKNVMGGSRNSEAIVVKDTGYSPLKIECSLGDPLTVNSHLKSVEPPIHSNAHEH